MAKWGVFAVAPLFNTDNIDEILQKTEACADETYPAIKGKKKEWREENKELFDKKGRFTGEALTTNSIEGGNWRIKYTLKTLYSNLESIFGRTVGILIKESIYTFRNGKPDISFAHQNSNFRYANVFLT